MTSGRVYNRDFLRGLQTSRPSDGADDFTGFRRFQNVRVDHDQAQIRPGRVRLQKLTPSSEISTCCDFDGASTWRAPLHYTAPRPNIWGLSARGSWTLEALFKSDLVTADHGIVTVGSTNQALELWIDASSKITARFTDASLGIVSIVGPTVTTAVTHVRVTRSGSTYSFYVDGTLIGTSTLNGVGIRTNPSGYLVVGRCYGPGAYYFDGRVEHVTLYDGLLPNFKNMRNHLLAPRQRRVLACYRGAPTLGTVVADHSSYEFHGLLDAGTVTAGATIANPHNPVQAIETFINKPGQRRAAVVAGGTVYSGAL